MRQDHRPDRALRPWESILILAESFAARIGKLEAAGAIRVGLLMRAGITARDLSAVRVREVTIGGEKLRLLTLVDKDKA